ncbi:hypothetical protein AB5N19_13152 [Seiridium cardinale]
MARLNEPVVAPDGVEILRRKFLRQNRDIARINSTQSLRIRSLENECARMLSENLELRSQILRLETEIKDSRAQRIADHALEIKEKMEAQLLEWGTMLASLGHEPIPKHRSPRAPKRVRRDPSLGLAGAGSPRFRRRNTSELEAAAVHEGRLAPLWENRPCPRETLSRDEIMALCSEAAETDSPDLGPPPVSRFVDEDPVKIDLPTKSSSDVSPGTNREESFPDPLPKVVPEPVSETEIAEQEVTKKPEPILSKAQPRPVVELAAPEPQVPNLNLKRKSRDDEEKENFPIIKVGGDPAKSAKALPAKTANRPLNRPMKDIPSAKKDDHEKITASAPALAPRKPLGAKSANEAVNSPKKTGKGPLLDEIAKAKADMKNHERAKETKTTKKKKEEIAKPVPIPAHDSPPASAVITEIEPETLSAEPHLSAPESPESATTREEMRDTPPPGDISSTGESGRVGRRARSNVSYAEPNLRDKMRRPTKQLFDAVAGEGKAMRRTSQSKPNESSSVKSEEKSSGWKPLPAKSLSDTEKADDIAASPLVQKVARISPSKDLPTSILTNRRKQDPPTVGQGDGLDSSASSAGKLATRPMNKKLEDIAAREVEVAKMFDQPDVYDFTSTSPNGKKAPTIEQGKRHSTSRNSKSRRLSSMLREDVGTTATESHEKGRGPRKRASMTVHKTTPGCDADSSISTDGDSSFNSNSSGDMDVAGRGVSMRRGSMML